MLYEMAQKHDEWPGEDYEGSSCRGAIRGWSNMGVCSEEDWAYEVGDPGELTVPKAIAARENPIGAYYRLRPDIVDYHAALNEVDAIYVSARVHSGWFNPKADKSHRLAVIQPTSEFSGGHAFAIVGYNSTGFIVQNSWGAKWGTDGFAIWRYVDWEATVSDGWVFRLGIATPTIFGKERRVGSPTEEAELFNRGPKRREIAGHFAHFDDGKFAPHGNYWTTAQDIQNTANRIKESREQYKHLLIYAHGGLNSTQASARRIAALKEGFKRNGVYPFHIMYDTGLVEELKDVVLRAFTGAESRAENMFDWVKEKITESIDKLIEDAVRKPVTPLWEEMKRDAHGPFDLATAGTPDGLEAIKIMAKTLKGTGIKFHLAGHSTGGILIGHLLNALDALKINDLISSCTLFAPACTIGFYENHYEPRLQPKHKGTRLPVLDIYNLTGKLELDDNVARAYNKSLLYLVSNALERSKNVGLLGMQVHSKHLKDMPNLNFVYSTGRGKGSRSTSHGGFDNDVTTMNSLLQRVLSRAPKEPFREVEMKGY
jgi:hypothetical protein